MAVAAGRKSGDSFHRPANRPPAHAASSTCGISPARARAIAAYSGLSSIPKPSRPRPRATLSVVPEPTKGSRTSPRCVGASQPQGTSGRASGRLSRNRTRRLDRRQGLRQRVQTCSGVVARTGLRTSASGKVAMCPATRRPVGSTHESPGFFPRTWPLRPSAAKRASPMRGAASRPRPSSDDARATVALGFERKGSRMASRS